MLTRPFPVLVLALVDPLAWAGSEPLTLDQALRLARENNGTVRAARLSLESSRANARAANAAFLPTVTPSVIRQDGRSELYTGPFRGGSTIGETNTTLSAAWLLFDSGSRGLNVRRAQTQRDQTEQNALETLRQTLFQVHRSFYDALRAQELLRVQVDSVARAKTLVDRAVLSEEVGAGAKIDILQARADLANAQVGELTARNTVATSAAELKAVLAWPNPALPELARPDGTALTMSDDTLDALISEAVQNRPGLRAARQRAEAARIDARIARVDAGVTFSATARYDRDFDRDVSDRSLLVLQASVPLFDGSRSRETVKSADFSARSSEETLAQDEREVRAEVESAFKEYVQNKPRFEASQVALQAARVNYQAASEAYREGANDLIAVLTAQVSLTTAETNAIQALYDLLVSEVRLKLAAGRPLPGEQE